MSHLTTAKVEETRQVHDFRRLFVRAADGGRAEALFGIGSLEAAAGAIQRVSISGTLPLFYHLEMPLFGKPCMDLFVEYACGSIGVPVRFTGGDGYGWLPFVENCARDDALHKYMLNFAFDLSQGQQRPNIYLIPPFRSATVHYVPDMLERLACANHADSLMAAFRAAPPGWKPYYAGLMEARPDSPVRLGFQVSQERMCQYAEDISLWENDLSVYGKGAFGETMTGQLSLLAREGRPCDLDLNMYPDGTFGDGFGVTLDPGIKRLDPRRPEEVMGRGVMRALLDLATTWHLADARQELIGKACYAVQRIVQDGTDRVRVADVSKPYAIKIRFNADGACLAKVYMTLLSRELERWAYE